ncbi:hypothetical protein E2C01_032903 [Portunus trituberculatus]|uniref:Uncharacterized protein n=1 Tax=Portunus trituberculatus TaxID=210409 RepID=A0A5B7F2G5_PORTR|nr:hypothetical protein [Portunus trituberculatus]
MKNFRIREETWLFPANPRPQLPSSSHYSAILRLLHGGNYFERQCDQMSGTGGGSRAALSHSNPGVTPIPFTLPVRRVPEHGGIIEVRGISRVTITSPAGYHPIPSPCRPGSDWWWATTLQLLLLAAPRAASLPWVFLPDATFA